MNVRIAGMMLVVAMSLAGAPSAWAFSEVATTAANPYIQPSECSTCHGGPDVSVDATGVARQGPHGGYTTASTACASCHITHAALPGAQALLPGATMTETCELCHDGTGGKGVYGTIEARLGPGSAKAAHRTETSNIVPGGDESTGGGSTRDFGGFGGTLTCGDCHSPHGFNLVAPFTTDRRRTATDTTGFVSSQLLRARPSGASTPTTEYGSDWCMGCHAGRTAGLHAAFNHPVDASATSGPSAFVYERLQVVREPFPGPNSSKTASGTLGQSNFGYVMPWARTSGQGDHAPICQQCHEDARSVGDVRSGRIADTELFAVTTADGGSSTDNPRFQVFPHESQNAGLVIESRDDLCTNCHHSGQLP